MQAEPSRIRRVGRIVWRSMLAFGLGIALLVGSALLGAAGVIGLAVYAVEARPDWLRSHEPPRSELGRSELGERGPLLLAAAGLAGTVLAADAIAHRDDPEHEPPVGGVLLGSLATVGVADYVVSHRDELVAPAILLGIAGLVILFSDPESDTSDASADDADNASDPTTP